MTTGITEKSQQYISTPRYKIGASGASANSSKLVKVTLCTTEDDVLARMDVDAVQMLLSPSTSLSSLSIVTQQLGKVTHLELTNCPLLCQSNWFAPLERLFSLTIFDACKYTLIPDSIHELRLLDLRVSDLPTWSESIKALELVWSSLPDSDMHMYIELPRTSTLDRIRRSIKPIHQLHSLKVSCLDCDLGIRLAPCTSLVHADVFSNASLPDQLQTLRVNRLVRSQLPTSLQTLSVTSAMVSYSVPLTVTSLELDHIAPDNMEQLTLSSFSLSISMSESSGMRNVKRMLRKIKHCERWCIRCVHMHQGDAISILKKAAFLSTLQYLEIEQETHHVLGDWTELITKCPNLLQLKFVGPPRALSRVPLEASKLQVVILQDCAERDLPVVDLPHVKLCLVVTRPLFRYNLSNVVFEHVEFICRDTRHPLDVMIGDQVKNIASNVKDVRVIPNRLQSVYLRDEFEWSDTRAETLISNVLVMDTLKKMKDVENETQPCETQQASAQHKQKQDRRSLSTDRKQWLRGYYMLGLAFAKKRVAVQNQPDQAQSAQSQQSAHISMRLVENSAVLSLDEGEALCCLRELSQRMEAFLLDYFRFVPFSVIQQDHECRIKWHHVLKHQTMILYGALVFVFLVHAMKNSATATVTLILADETHKTSEAMEGHRLLDWWQSVLSSKTQTDYWFHPSESSFSTKGACCPFTPSLSKDS